MYKVLIIDDEPWSREVVKVLGEWKNLKLQVIGEAEDGREGLRLIGELYPDIVITDMRMPGMEGVELLQAINEKFPNLKIIVMSGYSDFAYLKQAIRTRAIEYLLKPMNVEELNLALIRSIEELDKDSAKTKTLWQQQLKFRSNIDLDEYIYYRQFIFEYLSLLNKPGVLNTIEKLGAFLNQTLQENEIAEITNKIGQNFISFLKEFIFENKRDFVCIEGKREYCKTSWSGIDEMINDIGNFYGEAIDIIEAFRKSKNRFDLAEVKVYIDRHYKEPISLDTIAQHFFVSKEHLSRTFKTHTAENLSEYIIRLRMNNAKELLVVRRLEIKDVAEIVGYTDVAYFYRVFKKYFGITPGDMQKK